MIYKKSQNNDKTYGKQLYNNKWWFDDDGDDDKANQYHANEKRKITINNNKIHKNKIFMIFI